MWSLPLAPKLKHFLWRACHDILPTSHNLFKRKVLNTTCCCQCFYHDETLEHALFRCTTVQEVWNLTIFLEFIDKNAFLNCMDLLSLAATTYSARDYRYFLCFLWKLWNCRNNWLHTGLYTSPSQVLQWVGNYLDQYQSCNTRCSTPSSTPDIPLLSAENEPRTPSYSLRLSTDATRDVRTNKMGFGMTIQSSQGETLLTLATPWSGLHQPLLMEVHALQYALSWCHNHSLVPDNIVSDCKVLVNYICNNDTHNIHLNKFVTAINSLLSYFPKAFISYIPRGANKMAHSLAKKALGLDQEALWTSSTLAL
ncbi:hypothetical protein F8388_018217 [Cannabis sativa]|uniref:Reverse transcriptase zinc-binding domain-containing protein n=1 Tax=Cannabis sativa TaxID=3483 RepID=A0A7J6GAW1_CANSA|nr:hypothetical protein F8388_018217 [Cannabis sativa]